MAVFPNELVDRIIDHLHFDISALRRGSLVCKTWLPRCRYHLFERITIEEEAVLQGLLDLDAFFPIAPYIQSLVLVWSRVGGPRAFVGSRWCMKNFSALRSLTHMHFDSRKIPQDQLPPFVESFADLKVTELVFEHAYFATFDQLAQIITSCPSLQRISLRDHTVLWAVEAGSVPVRRLPSRSLEKLYLWSRCPMIIGLMTWMLSDPEPVHLRRLHLDYMGIASIPYVANFIQALGPALTHVELHFPMVSSEFRSKSIAPTWPFTYR
jgi:hypothetical protein